MRIAAVALAMTASALAGCGGSHPQHASATENAVNLKGKHVPLTTPSVLKGQQTVKLTVLSAKDRSTIAVIPVWIDGKGPYPFALDTGATKSLVDSHLVDRLGLPKTGHKPVLSGVAGSARGEEVKVHDWRAGQVALHPETVASLDLGGPGNGPAGLLGSDVLSRYGKIAIDYNKNLLVLDPHAVK